MLNKYITKPEWGMRRSVNSFTGATGHPMHLTGYSNHSRKVVVLGADTDISIVTVAKGYRVVTFRMPCLMTAMLVDEFGIGSIPCTTIGKRYINHNGLKEDEGHTTYHSESLDPTKLIGDDNYELLLSIAKAIRKHYDNASNSFGLYCSNEEIGEYKTLLDTLESMISEEAVA